jgi:hypothetical protein
MSGMEIAQVRELTPHELERRNPYRKLIPEHIRTKAMMSKYQGLKIRETFPLWGNEINL